MDKAQPKTIFIILTTVSVISTVVVFLIIKQCQSNTNQHGDNPSSQGSSADKPNQSSIHLTPDGKKIDYADTRPAATAEELVGRIVEITHQANKTGNIDPLINLLGSNNLSAQQTQRLKELAQKSQLKFDATQPFFSVPGKNNRWSLNLFDRSRIFLDLEKNKNGNWRVSRITLPTNKQSTAQTNSGNPQAPSDKNSAEGIVHQFMEAIVKLNLKEARKHIDTSQVSYTKLAGLCIIFEESNYRLIKKRAIRKMFLRETTAGWLVQVEIPDQNQTAMFALNTKRGDAQSPWKITEINLDQLLTDYAKRFTSGDIHYTPIIKTPQGGETLVVYFDLDSETLTTRTQRQLNIVADLLKSDQQKKLTISGHTDGLGSDTYNLGLSKKRANTVMTFFAQKGIPKSQMDIMGFGKAKPRLPNQTQDGTDNPDGRRANRRAEILLKF